MKTGARPLNKVKTLPDAVNLQVIYVREEKPPAGKEPIEWFLVTSEPVNSSDEAHKYVEYYVQRWKIERFHYVLKSGCAIEKLQERSIDKSEALIFMYSIIAVRILKWKLLYCAANKTKKQREKPYMIKEAVDYLGWLGVPKWAPSDGPPWVKTIWIGLIKLYILLAYRDFLS